MEISALLTCHNRRDLTLSCLDSLKHQNLSDNITLKTVLVDDGRTDGTAAEVARSFPGVEVLSGDGSLFWCGGMRKAWEHADKADPDYLLLLNDDTILHPDAIQQLFGICPSPGELKIAVGAISDPRSGEISYGGRFLTPPKGLREPGGRILECDTFNGNCLMIPRAVRRVVGSLDPLFTHSFGDFDYGRRALRKGVRLLQTAGFVGTCESNKAQGSWRDTSLPRAERLKRLWSPKGLPLREHLSFALRHNGLKGLVRCLSPYIRILKGR